ncbi:MAG: helix-turn-helix domain-containing protein [Hyphomicrobiaceae bacterium]
MSIRVMTLVWDTPFPNVPAKMVALKLADCANDDGSSIYPSVPTVERATGCSASTIRKWLVAMQHCGLLSVIEHSHGGAHKDTTVRAFDMGMLRALSEGRLELREDEIEKPSEKDAAKRVKVTVFAVAAPAPVEALTPPSAGGVEDGTPPSAGGHPSVSRRPPLREPEATPPADGPNPSLTRQGTVTNPPPAPSLSTTGEQGGGEEISSSLKSEGALRRELAAVAKPKPIGWAYGWTQTARDEVEATRWSNNDATALVADVFIDSVRELRGPAPGPQPDAYVRELAAALRHFDRATLAALAEHQIKHRGTKLDSVPNLVRIAKAGFAAAAPAAANPAPAVVQISRTKNPAAVAAWIAYAASPQGRTDPKTRRLGQFLEQHGAWGVPTEFPPATASTGAAP